MTLFDCNQDQIDSGANLLRVLPPPDYVFINIIQDKDISRFHGLVRLDYKKFYYC